MESTLTPIILGITALITALTPILLALINSKARQAMENTEVTKQAALATADSVDKVHVAVNSERTAMLQNVTDLKDEILKLSKVNAVLVERLSQQRPP